MIINKVVYNDILVELNRVEKMVLISLISHNNWKTGICNPSIKTLQNEWFYASDREVIKALKTLQENEIISKETIKRKDYYSINIDLLNSLYYQQNVGNGNPQNVGTNNEIIIKK